LVIVIVIPFEPKMEKGAR